MIYRNFNFENDQKGIKEAEEEDDISNDIANHRLNANHKSSSNGVRAMLSGSKRSSKSGKQSDSKKCRTHFVNSNETHFRTYLQPVARMEWN